MSRTLLRLVLLGFLFSTFIVTSTVVPVTASKAKLDAMASPPTPYTHANLPVKLAVRLAPSKVMADNSRKYYVAAVQIQDSYGNPASATRDTPIELLSSNETVGTVATSVTINKGKNTAYVWFDSTYVPGSTTISAHSAFLATGSAVMTTVGALASKLAVILAPSKLPNDNTAHYYAVCVQIQDSHGNPALAARNTVVLLSSSNPTVGTVSTSVTINKGKNTAYATFYSTYIEGSTTITAFTPGLAPSSAVMTTTTGSTPTKLAVIFGPSQLPNDKSGHSYPVKVQLQDADGDPAKSAEHTYVTLTSSNTTVGTLPSSLTISSGKTYAYTSFTTTFTPGWTTITATAAGYASGSANMTTVGATPSKFAVILAPPELLNDNSHHYYPVKVQLQDASGNPAKAPVNKPVTLTSSDTTVGTVPSSVTISAGKTYAYGYFKSTYNPGSTTITATAAGYTSSSAVMTTVTGLTPTKLAVILGPRKLPNDNYGHSYSVIVQLQDAKGDPASAPATIVVLLASSNEAVGTVPPSVTMSSGQSTAYATFTSTYAPGVTTITAFTIGYSPGSASMATGHWYLGITIYTNKYSYTTGETMNVGLDVSNPGAETDVSVKVWLELPAGTTYTILDIPSIALPAGLSYSNPNQWTFVLPSITSGKYIWHATLDDPATGAILSHDTAVWEFT